MSVYMPADEFVEEWNGRKLYAKYYAGLTGGTSMRRTNHQWGIRQGETHAMQMPDCSCFRQGNARSKVMLCKALTFTMLKHDLAADPVIISIR